MKSAPPPDQVMKLTRLTFFVNSQNFNKEQNKKSSRTQILL
jgi:hypothetical protein